MRSSGLGADQRGLLRASSALIIGIEEKPDLCPMRKQNSEREQLSVELQVRPVKSSFSSAT